MHAPRKWPPHVTAAAQGHSVLNTAPLGCQDGAACRSLVFSRRRSSCRCSPRSGRQQDVPGARQLFANCFAIRSLDICNNAGVKRRSSRRDAVCARACFSDRLKAPLLGASVTSFARPARLRTACDASLAFDAASATAKNPARYLPAAPADELTTGSGDVFRFVALFAMVTMLTTSSPIRLLLSFLRREQARRQTAWLPGVVFALALIDNAQDIDDREPAAGYGGRATFESFISGHRACASSFYFAKQARLAWLGWVPSHLDLKFHSST